MRAASQVTHFRDIATRPTLYELNHAKARGVDEALAEHEGHEGRGSLQEIVIARQKQNRLSADGPCTICTSSDGDTWTDHTPRCPTPAQGSVLISAMA